MIYSKFCVDIFSAECIRHKPRDKERVIFAVFPDCNAPVVIYINFLFHYPIFPVPHPAPLGVCGFIVRSNPAQITYLITRKSSNVSPFLFYGNHLLNYRGEPTQEFAH